mgnify:CR=1 FL=1
METIGFIIILVQQYICDRHIFDAVLRCLMVFRMQRLEQKTGASKTGNVRHLHRKQKDEAGVSVSVEGVFLIKQCHHNIHNLLFTP